MTNLQVSSCKRLWFCTPCIFCTPLQVGISLNHVARLSQHKKAPWVDRIARVDIEAHPSRADALKAEAAIVAEKPAFNKQHADASQKKWSTVANKIDPRATEVTIFPMYDVTEASQALRLSAPALRLKIEAGEIGAVELWSRLHNGKKSIHWGITGWQMIEYLNRLEVLSPQVPK